MELEKLIELVRDHPVLYVTNHPDYTRTKMKDGLWEKIGAELDSDGKAVKEKWRKLRECHREAIRRQKKRKSGDAAERPKPWTYQYQMEFLIPYMKNRLTQTNLQVSPHSSSHPIVDDDEDVDNTAGDDEILPSSSNEETTNESIENEIPSKKANNRGDWALQQFTQLTERRVKSRDDLRENTLERELHSQQNQNDALYQFFLSMYYTTIGLSPRYQRQVRNKVFEAVAQAEEQHAHEQG